jgi:hypothetical protein
MTDISTEDRYPDSKEELEVVPFFKTWNQMYAFVIILHLLFISLLYFITIQYS